MLLESFLKDRFWLVYLYHYFFVLQLKSDMTCTKNICYISYAPVIFLISSSFRQKYHCLHWHFYIKYLLQGIYYRLLRFFLFSMGGENVTSNGENNAFLWNISAQFIPCSSYSTSLSFVLTGMLASARWFPINTK